MEADGDRRMKPSTVLAEQLIAALDNEDIKWREYSGRGMYGAYCIGVSYNNMDLDEEQILDAVKDVPGVEDSECRDSMGLGYILYWPDARLVYPAENETVVVAAQKKTFDMNEEYLSDVLAFYDFSSEEWESIPEPIQRKLTTVYDSV